MGAIKTKILRITLRDYEYGNMYKYRAVQNTSSILDELFSFKNPKSVILLLRFGLKRRS